MKRIVLSASAFLLLVLILIYPVVSKAVNNQVYSGDGAFNNWIIPPGGWDYTQATTGACFDCHVPGNTVGAPDKTAYLMTGHRNVLRMDPPTYFPPFYPFALTNPTGQPYSMDLFGNQFDWNNYTITIQGVCTVPPYTNPSSCVNGGGQWLSGTKSLFYIYGGWMNAAPIALYDGSYNQGGAQTAVSYSCGRCHTTGYTMDAAIDSRCGFITAPGKPRVWVCRTPEYDFPGITWTPSNTSGLINLDPDGNGPAFSSSWAVASSGQSLQGVQCERCHDATKHNPATMTPKGSTATALCLQCHRQDHVVTYTTGSMGANIIPTPATDNASLPVSEPVQPLPAIEVGRSDGSYAPVFYPYSTGMEYLNSVHGQFTGNFQQINDASKYLSSFITSSVDGGCTKCHDVHQSTVAAVNATAPFKKNCPDCHVEGTPAGLQLMFHPSGPGTPFGDPPNVLAACAKCHMVKPNSGEGRSSHIWRISTDASYTTFPTQTQWAAGQKTAFTAPSGNYPNAVWLDLDVTCGQCHGESGIAHFFSKATIAPFASGMHNSINGSASAVCLGCHSTQQDGFPAIAPGINHHGTTPGVTKECTECHTRPGKPLEGWQTNAFCRNCHTSTAGPYQVPDPQHPVSSYTPQYCGVCHGPGGFLPNPGNDLTCAQCHGGGTSSTSLFPGGALVPTAPWFSSTQLAAFAATIHTSSTATSTPPVVSHGTVTITGGYTVSFAETSYDPDGTVDAVTVAWGDGAMTNAFTDSGILSHTYATTTRTYTITHKVIDKINPNIFAQETFTVSLPQRYTVSGIVTTNTGTPLSGVLVTLWFNTSARAQVTSGALGTFTFAPQLPGGSYSLTAVKTGYTFNRVTIGTLASDVTVTIKAN